MSYVKIPAIIGAAPVPRGAHEGQVPAVVPAPAAAVGRGWPEHRVRALLPK